jgi:TPP-dependent pyruvate/acetoin dehydrogenase alpha subunit
MAQIRARCPIDRLAEALMQAGLLNAAGRSALQADVEAEVARALAFAQDAPLPRPEEALTDVG